MSKENSNGKWEEIREIYRKYKKKREVVVIKVKDQNKIIKESRKRTKEKENVGKKQMCCAQIQKFYMHNRICLCHLTGNIVVSSNCWSFLLAPDCHAQTF